jgi:hypothetical protein
LGPQDPAAVERFQMHLVLPYKFQPREDPRIRRHLDRGWRIVQLQRLTDREVVVTLARAGEGSPATPDREPSPPR